MISQAFIEICVRTARTLWPGSSPLPKFFVKPKPQGNDTSPPEPPTEAGSFYVGLPSAPRLVWRSGDNVWMAPTGLDSYHRRKVLCDVGEHAIKHVWEDNLALDVMNILKKEQVDWTSLDLIRILYAEPPLEPTPPIIWIGVTPSSLSRDDAARAGSLCVALLSQNDLADVEVHFRESIVTRGVGPNLLNPSLQSDPTADIQELLASTLGMSICAKCTQHVEGTGGFILRSAGDSSRRLLLTARHVVFPPAEIGNAHFDHQHGCQPFYDVILFGSAAFINFGASLQTAIGDEALLLQNLQKSLERLEGKDCETQEDRATARWMVEKAKKKMEGLNDLYHHVTTRWFTPQSRLLGHVILAPPIGVGIGYECYTRDWAIIEMTTPNFDSDDFIGNAIDLGTLPPGQFTRQMYPGGASSHSLECPEDGLLRLTRVMTNDEMRRPVDKDINDEPCRIVLQRGSTTGLSFGRASTVVSYTRHDVQSVEEISKEWSVLPYNGRTGPFSHGGDAGSVVADGRGCIMGILTGGSGTRDRTDITCVTPAVWLLQDIANHGIEKPEVLPAVTLTPVKAFSRLSRIASYW